MRRKRDVGRIAICDKSMKRDEIEATSNSAIFAVVIFSASAGGNKSRKLGGQEVLVGGGWSRTTVASMETRWSVGEVGSGGGNRCRWIGLVGGRGERWLYQIVSPTDSRGYFTLPVVEVEVKRVVGIFLGSVMKRG